jgi:hypothetical protein
MVREAAIFSIVALLEFVGAASDKGVGVDASASLETGAAPGASTGANATFETGASIRSTAGSVRPLPAPEVLTRGWTSERPSLRQTVSLPYPRPTCKVDSLGQGSEFRLTGIYD